MEKRKLDWQVDREFVDGRHVVSVRRARLDGNRSRWSFQVGVRREEDPRLNQFVGVFVDFKTLEFTPNPFQVLSRLLEKAEEYVAEAVAAEKAENSRFRHVERDDLVIQKRPSRGRRRDSEYEWG